GRAWTWEHQALLRARPVAGDPALHAELAALRREILAIARDVDAVYDEVSSMRRRWRAERDRSDAARFDLKQGPGGLLDIEFALQGLVLAHAVRHPTLLDMTSNAALIDACREAALLDAGQAEVFLHAHAELLQRALTCTLDLRSRIGEREPELMQLAATVQAVTRALGFAFDA
ncbi:MAG: glutamine-synthetase adenylyltransferase, partial [Lysobacterales bacterium 13-68-4]